MIQVGQVLDKYELLERVGQGGMSVVYRATDRSLRRTVAVKILHRHLADSAEARDRFEREAHAVAKLRHENIVEIFAYSGKASEDSYIVTEFIDGCTLKEFLGDHPISFPEVGAMIVLQVGRALAHAHANGILHRDVKPENVMIRSDGVVKLMDFGISQMVDLQRLTVTGQLLGSPAYMSPEHVEGQPLDFRTDVFACGIVLYQLATGRLPFDGKNPHEILKRIADCKFTDPRQANPRIGNELGKIILCAMAREPRDRYRDVGGLVAALESYATGSGLGVVNQELARYFQAPASYELALKERLVDHLVRKGKETMPINRPQALESFDRVLTVDPTNTMVLTVLERLNRGRQWKRGAGVGVAILLIAGGAFGARKLMQPRPPDAPVVVIGPGADVSIAVGSPDRAPPPDRSGASVDAAIAVVDRGAVPDRVRPTRVTPDAAGAALAAVTLTVSPRDSQVTTTGAPAVGRDPGVFAIPLRAAGPIEVTVTNDRCQAETRTFTAADAGGAIAINLAYLPGAVQPVCDDASVRVRIRNQNVPLGTKWTVTFGQTTRTTKQVTVEFITKDDVIAKTVEVKPNETREVSCAP